MKLNFYMNNKGSIAIVCFLTIFTCVCNSQIHVKEYDNGHGKKIVLPQGDISFADEVVSYKAGSPAPIQENSNPQDAIGIPDFNMERVTGFVSLGIGGELVVAFHDNALVNIDGPDLYVFEVGRYVEETYLYVSKNGKQWIKVGKIGGGNALVDIGDSTIPGEVFRYVKLVDAGSSSQKGDKMCPGADIDAIAAIGSAKQLALNALYLFNTNEAKLKPEAKTELDAIVIELKQNPDYRIVVAGHTDSIGNKTLNFKLSNNRAKAVSDYFISKLPELKNKITCIGYADDQPVANNRSEEGRMKNRRVEVYFIPANK